MATTYNKDSIHTFNANTTGAPTDQPYIRLNTGKDTDGKAVNNWSSGTAVYAGQIWIQGGVHYLCKQNHTTSATNQPGSGAEQDRYWDPNVWQAANWAPLYNTPYYLQDDGTVSAAGQGTAAIPAFRYLDANRIHVLPTEEETYTLRPVGSAADTAAIMLALSLSKGKYPIQLEAGTYHITDMLQLTSNDHLIGDNAIFLNKMVSQRWNMADGAADFPLIRSRGTQTNVAFAGGFTLAAGQQRIPATDVPAGLANVKVGDYITFSSSTNAGNWASSAVKHGMTVRITSVAAGDLVWTGQPLREGIPATITAYWWSAPVRNLKITGITLAWLTFSGM